MASRTDAADLVRPLRETDLSAANDIGYQAIYTMSDEFGLGYDIPDPITRTDEDRQRGVQRIGHLLRTDPRGSWVAEVDGQVAGVALASLREGTWFLSLLAVATEHQSKGIGKALLDASLTYAQPGAPAWILATGDPKALRRYWAAGFRILPTYGAKGSLDRSLVPGGLAVRDGDLAGDSGLVEATATEVRGAAYGPDLEQYLRPGHSLLVVDDPSGRGYAIVATAGPVVLGATDDAIAQRLLWAALARADELAAAKAAVAATTEAAKPNDGPPTPPKLEVEFMTAEQGWAIDVAMQARFAFGWGASVCLRDVRAPFRPLLPNGAYG